ncbi:type II toxin-antitoxin system Phd/YefM family antitoxin, partial [Candidatus Gottesmanbacteria bacterium]|nr:type II toxin-antitoxin system Phd/YefM family antitoxin [Candidatus Gottesmanbacteria bacterium]MBI5452754.1 type II toxin-antitoxin system Phd/YefM family antitoxin [Candidatus Gottesmanbacteria bacterium]
MTQTVSAQDVRNKFAEVLNTAVYGSTNVIITRFNKPQAVIMNYKEYERLMNPRLRF